MQETKTTQKNWPKSHCRGDCYRADVVLRGHCGNVDERHFSHVNETIQRHYQHRTVDDDWLSVDRGHHRAAVSYVQAAVQNEIAVYNG